MQAGEEWAPMDTASVRSKEWPQMNADERG